MQGDREMCQPFHWLSARSPFCRAYPSHSLQKYSPAYFMTWWPQLIKPTIHTCPRTEKLKLNTSSFVPALNPLLSL